MKSISNITNLISSLHISFQYITLDLFIPHLCREEVTETTHEEAPLGGIHHERTIIQDEPSLVIEGEQIEAPEEFKQPPPKVYLLSLL